jgi:glycosyltransferase involved in cell wall biosynthesis
MSRQLIVVGACSIERGEGGRFKTKTPLADYLFRLCDRFDRVILYAPFSPTNLFTGELQHERLEIVPSGWKAGFGIGWKLLFGRANYVLLHLPNAARFAPIVPFIRGRVHSCVTYLGVDFEREEASSGFLQAVRTRAFRAAHRRVIKHSHCVIARGKYLAKLCSALNPHVVETVPLGHMSGGADRAERPGASLRLLVVGKVSRRKGIAVILEAVSILRQRQHDVGLDVLGDGADVQWAIEEASRLGIADCVAFHGWVDDLERLETFWAAASALAVPSVASEGVPRVIEEAIIRKLPVIATTVGGIADQFPNGEIALVPPGDAQQMANGIERLLFDDTFRQGILAAARGLSAKLATLGTAGDQHSDLLLAEPMASRPFAC